MTNTTKIRVGIPRGFFYHLFSRQMEVFFDTLGVEIVLSPKTNQKILQDGIALSIDETCLAEKIYMGHVKWLAGKCDKIFVPRMQCFSMYENPCPKFFATHDIAKTFVKADYIGFDINALQGLTEKKAYISLGRELGFSKKESRNAYLAGVAAQKKYKEEQHQIAEEQLKSDKIKIAVISHAYETNDEFIGMPIIRSLKKNGAEVILTSNFADDKYKLGYKDYAETFNWFHNKELLGIVSWIKDKVDGIVIISVFPCGPDSMTNEVLRLEQKTVPMISLLVDEIQGQAGIETRIESFIDILKFKKQGGLK